MRIDIPAAALDIIKKINASGYEAYIVGGCVRDSLLGRAANDWDITTSASPDIIKSIFRRTVDTGIKHGTVTVLINDEAYEITTYRIDGEYEDGRHPNSVTFTASLEEDLKRRDFTINAMAYHPDEGIVDLFDGQKDLENKIIRCVGDPVQRFTEDALRMMRAIRFAAQLGYEIDENTFKAIKKLAPNLGKVSAERIQLELTKLLVSDNPYFFKKFYETGLTKVFMPEFDKAMETDQKHIHHMYSVGEHILHTLKNVPAKKEYRLAMLIHDMGKPEALSIDSEGITHFYGHPKISAAMADNILHRLKFDNATIDMVHGYVLNHDRQIELDENAMRHTIHKIGEKYFPGLFDIFLADILAQSSYMRDEKLKINRKLRELYEKIIKEEQPISLKDLAVTGRDLIDEGFESGKNLGIILNKMLEDVLNYPEHNTKEYLMKHFAKI